MVRRFHGRVNTPALFALMVLMLLVAAACDPTFNSVFVSVREPGVTEDGVEYSTEDILFTYDNGAATNWQKVFDGSDFGLTTRHNISAFSFNEIMWTTPITFPFSIDQLEVIPELYLSFAPNAVIVPGVPTKVAGHDIVRFTEVSDGVGTFEMFFDGSDVGLTLTSEKIDGIGVWPPENYDVLGQDVELPVDCNAGAIFVTTMGRYRVPAADGGSIVGNGSDILLFCAFNTGPNTAGLWYRVFNGEKSGITPLHAGFSADVLGFGELAPTEQAPDLESSIIFAFTPRKPFTHPDLDEPGLPSQLFIAFGQTPFSAVEGPILDFNEPQSSPENLPAVNGTVDSIGLFDFPSMSPPP